MSSSELVDIHVLKETASRVSSLTASITKQVVVVEEVSQNARKALGPASRQNRNLEQFKDNVGSVLNIFDTIENASRQLRSFEKRITAGPIKLGWEEYIETVTKVRSFSSELSLAPEYRKFPQLLDSAEHQFQLGVEKLLKYLGQIAKLVFVPTDGVKHLDNKEAFPSFIPEEIASLAKLGQAISEIPDVSSSSLDNAWKEAIDEYMTKSLSSVVARAEKAPGEVPAQVFSSLCDSAKRVLLNTLPIIFSNDAQRLHSFQELVEHMARSHEDKFRSTISSKAPPPPPAISDSAETAQRQNSVGKSTHPASADSNAALASGRYPPKSSDTTKGKRMSRDHSMPSFPMPAPKSSTPDPTGLKVNTSSAAGIPSGSGAFDSPVSAKSNPSTNNSGPSTGGGTSWAAFEYIESSKDSQAPHEELARAKRDGLTTLTQVFSDIETQCKKAPITSEYGVSGASLQFMKTLQYVSAAGHAVEVVLSEVATRAYLSKPLPPWAAKSEPSPAARANPLSLYYADALLCLYFNLHQVASEQLKDTTKTGIFMLSNLTAIEHYITNSKNESLGAVTTKTELMESMGDIALQKFQHLMEQSFKEYLTDWSKLAPHLMESTITGSGASNAKLSSKERDTVKEKFRLFNAEFEALVERQKKYQISDANLRLRMTQEVKKLIGPLYTRFYLKHKDGDFTKNIAKYVKYTPAQFDEAIKF